MTETTRERPNPLREQAELLYSQLREYAQEIGKDGAVFDNTDFKRSALALLEARLTSIGTYHHIQSQNTLLKRACEMIHSRDNAQGTRQPDNHKYAHQY